MDVLQLADVLENFVESSTREYKINLLYSYSLPGYTWKAGLMLTNMKLDFIKETQSTQSAFGASGKELSLLSENNINMRGGISSVMGDRHVQSTSGGVNKQILYIDANNLYGWAMSQYLPTGEFEKLHFPEEYEIEKRVEDIMQSPDNNPFGFFIECDLLYPAELKEKTKNFFFRIKQKLIRIFSPII